MKTFRISSTMNTIGAWITVLCAFAALTDLSLASECQKRIPKRPFVNIHPLRVRKKRFFETKIKHMLSEKSMKVMTNS